ncbi:alcohol dehydrogenase catalytic domain-containing protein [Microbacterium timonense]|uniref:alcohol dehydrogenase catalytic domain-containing protein n=1 Tax=Microbacterium timonense TaxID=2086576 RepID=UPI000D10126C|nr:alcohol dehydrogenase catalytic domain-containing protein [Microbacterium timonense]
MRALVLNGEWKPRSGYELTAEEVEGRWAREARQVWRHPSWRVTDVERPAIASADDVVVRVRAAGLAVSTLRMTREDAEGYVMLPYRMGLPVIPGHEFSGEVVEVGTAVDRLRPGDAVAVQALRPCGHCTACRMLLPNSCQQADFAGFTLDGGIAEYAVAPQAYVHSLESLRPTFDADAVFDIGVLCEPAAVAYLALFEKDRHLRPGVSVAVFGCGPLGLAAVALARCAGAATVIAVDEIEERAELARLLGADEVCADSAAESGTTVLRATRGIGVDVAVDATGAASEVLPTIQRVLGVGGHIVHLGVGGPAAPFSPIAAMVQGATQTFSMGHVGGYQPVVELHARGRIDLRAMIGKRWPLEQVLGGLADPATSSRAKAVVIPA